MPLGRSGARRAPYETSIRGPSSPSAGIEAAFIKECRMKAYLDLLRDVRENGARKPTRAVCVRPVKRSTLSASSAVRSGSI